MFKTLHMMVTIVRTMQIAKILLEDYNINIKSSSDFGPTEFIFKTVMLRRLNNRQIAQEAYEMIQIRNNLFV